MFDKEDEGSINQNPFSLHKYLVCSLFNKKKKNLEKQKPEKQWWQKAHKNTYKW